MRKDVEPSFTPERSADRRSHTTAALGLCDSPLFPIGLADATAVTFATRNPRTGNPVHLTKVDLPVNGLGLELLLRTVSPHLNMYEVMRRENTIEDWQLPDSMDDVDDVSLHNKHMRLAPYGQFVDVHRRRWMDTMMHTEGDTLFRALWETRFVQPERFVHGMIEGIKGEYAEWVAKEKQFQITPKDSPGQKLIEGVHGTTLWYPLVNFVKTELVSGRNAAAYRRDRRKSALTDLLLSEESDSYGQTHYDFLRKEFPDEFLEVYLDNIAAQSTDFQMQTITHSNFVSDYAQHSGFVFIDPLTGKRWVKEDLRPIIDGEGIAFSFSEDKISFATPEVSVVAQLGPLEEDGHYPFANATFSYGGAYKSQALYPLIAWEETPSGRKVLPQEEAIGLMPENERTDNLDVMLGTVILAHGKPQVQAQFVSQMGLPGGTEVNHMGPVQVVILMHLPQYERKLLADLPERI